MGTFEGAGRYEGQAPDMNRVALSVGFGSSILNIPAPAPNASYTLQYYSPALQCHPATNATEVASLLSTSPNDFLYNGFVNALLLVLN